MLSLVDALKTNNSLKDLTLEWLLTHPDYTLKLMAEVFKETNLKRIFFCMNMALNVPTGSVSSEEEVIEWLQRVEVGGKELIMSVEDSRHLKTLHLSLFSNFLESSSLSVVKLETCTSLEAVVASVNSVRSEKSYCALNFSCTIH